jgi:hypothetical protein
MPRAKVNPNVPGVYPGPSAGVQKVDSNDSRGQGDDEHHSADGAEQVPGHASADDSSDGDPVIPVEPPWQQCESHETEFLWYIFERLRLLAADALYRWVILTVVEEYY